MVLGEGLTTGQTAGKFIARFAIEVPKAFLLSPTRPFAVNATGQGDWSDVDGDWLVLGNGPGRPARRKTLGTRGLSSR